MKKIAFITLYDVGAMGIRLLSSLAMAKGVETQLIFFKEGKLEKPVWGTRKGKSYTFYDDGVLFSSTSMADPPTEMERQLLIEQVLNTAPDLICISTRSFGLDLSREIITDIRTVLPSVPIIAGGWGPTTEPEAFLEIVDYICLGEGEKAFADIVDRLKQQKGFNDVNNIARLGPDHTILQNTLYPPLTIDELDALPYPDYGTENVSIITDSKILDGHAYDQVSNYVCMATRGCPMSCSYCQSGQYKRIYAQYGYHCPKMRTRSVDVVIAELLEAKNRGAHTITMRDEVFPFKRSWVERFVKLYKKEIDLPFFAYIRPEFHSAETIMDLVNAGLYLTRIGIQSGSDFILKNVYHRGLKKEKALDFALLLDDLGVDYSYHMLGSNPLEQINHLKEAFSFCCRLPYKPTRVFRLVVFPGSRLQRMITENKDDVLPDAVSDWYCTLYCMATKGPFYRKIAMLIHRTRLCRMMPYLLQLLFVHQDRKFGTNFFAQLRRTLVGPETHLRLPAGNPLKNQ